jgi:alkaline phosphatase D
VLTADTDYTGKVRVRCDRGRTVYYRVTAEDLYGRSVSEPVTGSLRVRPARGEGFGSSGRVTSRGRGGAFNPDDGGMRIFAAMRERDPDFFICSGDTADASLRETVTLAEGRIWRNVVTPEKSKVAETLAEFRGQFAYNLLDEHLRAFAAAVPQVNQWDDHEVINNWYPGEVPTDDRYTEWRVDVLAARVFQEWVPLDPRRAVDRRLPYGPHVEVFVIDMRSYRDVNSANTAPGERILGERQARWLVHALAASRATWKIVAADLPIGLLVPDGTAWEAVANGVDGPLIGARGRARLGAPVAAQAENAQCRLADRRRALYRGAPAGAGFTEFDEFWGSCPARYTPADSGRTGWRRQCRTRRRWTGSSTSVRSRWRRVERRCGCRCATALVPSCGRPRWRPHADRCRRERRDGGQGIHQPCQPGPHVCQSTAPVADLRRP